MLGRKAQCWKKEQRSEERTEGTESEGIFTLLNFFKITNLQQHGLKGSADRSTCPEAADHLFLSEVFLMSREREKEKVMESGEKTL